MASGFSAARFTTGVSLFDSSRAFRSLSLPSSSRACFRARITHTGCEYSIANASSSGLSLRESANRASKPLRSAFLSTAFAKPAARFSISLTSSTLSWMAACDGTRMRKSWCKPSCRQNRSSSESVLPCVNWSMKLSY